MLILSEGVITVYFCFLLYVILLQVNILRIEALSTARWGYGLGFHNHGKYLMDTVHWA